MTTTSKLRFTGRTWLRLAFVLEGTGEILQMICFALCGALVYAMFTRPATGSAPLAAPPTDLLAASAVAGFAGMSAALLAPVLRSKGLRLLAIQRTRPTTADQAAGVTD